MTRVSVLFNDRFRSGNHGPASLRIGLSMGAVAALVVGASMATMAQPVDRATAVVPSVYDKTTFHSDAARTGWSDNEAKLTPRSLADGKFGLVWRSEAFDTVGDSPARLFATPLYLHDVGITVAGRVRRRSVVFAVASTGYVYAVNARPGDGIAAGAILWRTRLTDQPCSEGRMGNLSTPVIDRATGRLYVTSCDDKLLWRAHALSLADGSSVPGWPVAIDANAVNRPGVNRNGTTQFPRSAGHLQRGALNLSADGRRLYVAFGGDSASGWLTVVDTQERRVATAFSTTPKTEERQGGMWGSSGPAVDGQGNVYIAAGTGIRYTKEGLNATFPRTAGNWGQSIMKLSDRPGEGFRLIGTYTPFNYCHTAATDIDLGSSGPIVIDMPKGSTSTPQLLTLLGAKQGNAYLLDRANMPGRTDIRQPCSDDSATDKSLLAPDPQPNFGKRGPISLFAPYSDTAGMIDQAKSRSTGAVFHAANGQVHLISTGSSKTGEKLDQATPPGLVRLELVTSPGKPAYLKVAARNMTETLHNPGSPVVSSHRGTGAVVWVLDMNARRSTSLYGPDSPKPILYAFDAITLNLIWKSGPDDLGTSGKYNAPTVADGQVFVGTDRIEAFALGADPALPRPTDRAKGTAKTAVERAAADKGSALFAARCAACHDSGLPGIPQRAALSAMPRDRIITALTTGIMQSQATGLSEQEIKLLVDHVRTAKP